jgi:hypothetical protein
MRPNSYASVRLNVAATLICCGIIVAPGEG